MNGAEIVVLAVRYARVGEVTILPAMLVTVTGMVGIVVSRLSPVFGVLSAIDPVFVVTAAIGALSLAGNAWIEYQWRMRRRKIDAVDYERRKKLDLQLYEKRLEKETGFDLDSIITPDPD